MFSLIDDLEIVLCLKTSVNILPALNLRDVVAEAANSTPSSRMNDRLFAALSMSDEFDSAIIRHSV